MILRRPKAAQREYISADELASLGRTPLWAPRMHWRLYIPCILALLCASLALAGRPSYLAEVDEDSDRRSAEEVLTEEGLILSSEGSRSKETKAAGKPSQAKPLKRVPLPKKNATTRIKRQASLPWHRLEGVVTSQPLEESNENSHVHIKYENGTDSDAEATTRQYHYHFAKPSADPVDEVLGVLDDTGHKDPVLHTLPPKEGETTPEYQIIEAVADETYEEDDEPAEALRSNELEVLPSSNEGRPGTRHTRTVPTLTPELAEGLADTDVPESAFGPELSVDSAVPEETSTDTEQPLGNPVDLEVRLGLNTRTEDSR